MKSQLDVLISGGTIEKEIHEDIFSAWESCRLMSNNKFLNGDDTLLKAGVFDGSIITVREV